MKKFYQSEWQGIKFRDFADISTKNIAGPSFYEAFYREFFQRNKIEKPWAALSVEWRAIKDRVSDLIVSRMREGERTLSVGCGLGYVEKQLATRWQIFPEVTETSRDPLSWLAIDYPPERIYVGNLPHCLPTGAKYNLVYLSAVDYCFDADEWQSFLLAIKEQLTDGGRCLVISASLQDTTCLSKVRQLGRGILRVLGLRDRGQFWGYLRTRDDYRQAMKRAGFKRCEEGALSDGTYFWIEGCIE